MAQNNNNLSTDPYRGTRDFYPEDMFIQNYIFSKMRGVAERYGYVEYGASILEETALYRAKSGSEIVNEQTYSFTDRGGRDVTIRPEMTPTIARMVAGKRKELSFPLRWYSIPNLFRYERPQRGRLREHWQLNVDLFGIDNVEADAEIISVAADIMKSFGAKDDQFEISINSRKLITYVTQVYLGLKQEDAYALTKLIDRKEKMKSEEFLADAKKLLGDQVSKLEQFLNYKTLDELPREFEAHGAGELRTLAKILDAKGIRSYEFSPSLIRGFDYYTGMVFEVFDTNPKNNRSLFGGGRYDDLVGMFGAEKVPGVGFGMGDVTVRDFMETYGLLPKYIPPTQLYICRLKPEFAMFADELATSLRNEGISVAVDYTDRKILAQIKTAEKQSIPYIVCIGEDEVRTKMVKLKNLKTREETTMSQEALLLVLKKV